LLLLLLLLLLLFAATSFGWFLGARLGDLAVAQRPTAGPPPAPDDYHPIGYGYALVWWYKSYVGFAPRSCGIASPRVIWTAVAVTAAVVLLPLLLEAAAAAIVAAAAAVCGVCWCFRTKVLPFVHKLPPF
jgi:hypothetical protein